jgi:hypothetical protein
MVTTGVVGAASTSTLLIFQVDWFRRRTSSSPAAQDSHHPS